MNTPKPEGVDCVCHRCIKDNNITVDWGDGLKMPYNATYMILCPKCGCKRCPHASDHRLDCTNSNEPGQSGSIYA